MQHPDKNFGIYARIVRGVVRHFPLRYLEWIMGVWAVAWGAKLILDPADNFSTTSGSFNILAAIFHADWVFGALMVFFGGWRLVALTVNGTFSNTIYAQYSPVVRGVTSFLCGFGWFLVALSAFPAASLAAFTFPFPFIIEFFTAYYVVAESGDTLRAHRHGRSNVGAS